MQCVTAATSRKLFTRCLSTWKWPTTPYVRRWWVALEMRSCFGKLESLHSWLDLHSFMTAIVAVSDVSSHATDVIFLPQIWSSSRLDGHFELTSAHSSHFLNLVSSFSAISQHKSHSRTLFNNIWCSHLRLLSMLPAWLFHSSSGTANVMCHCHNCSIAKRFYHRALYLSYASCQESLKALHSCHMYVSFFFNSSTFGLCILLLLLLVSST